MVYLAIGFVSFLGGFMLCALLSNAKTQDQQMDYFMAMRELSKNKENK